MKEETDKEVYWRWRKCARKLKHTSKKAHAFVAKRKKRDPWLNAYKCEYCEWWHVGHKH